MCHQTLTADTFRTGIDYYDKDNRRLHCGSIEDLQRASGWDYFPPEKKMTISNQTAQHALDLVGSVYGVWIFGHGLGVLREGESVPDALTYGQTVITKPITRDWLLRRVPAQVIVANSAWWGGLDVGDRYVLEFVDKRPQGEAAECSFALIAACYLDRRCGGAPTDVMKMFVTHLGVDTVVGTKPLCEGCVLDDEYCRGVNQVAASFWVRHFARYAMHYRDRNTGAATYTVAQAARNADRYTRAHTNYLYANRPQANEDDWPRGAVYGNGNMILRPAQRGVR